VPTGYRADFPTAEHWPAESRPMGLAGNTKNKGERMIARAEKVLKLIEAQESAEKGRK